MHSKTKDNFIAFRGRVNYTASIAADTYSATVSWSRVIRDMDKYSEV